MPSGEPVERIKIGVGGLSASILTYGAVIQQLRLAGFDYSLVLGLESLDHYTRHSPYFGAVAGRVANRLSYGRFTLEGKTFQIDRNIEDTHTLHGGRNGFGVRNWTISEAADNFVELELFAPDGEMGFPGNLQVKCRYEIRPYATFRIELTAETDAPTPCNLAPHSYFNLDGTDDILSHHLEIDATKITVINERLLPTGELMAVKATPYDFINFRQISTGRADGMMRFDHNYCLSRESTDLRRVARLRSLQSGIDMTLATTTPGLQFYDGAKIAVPVIGIDGRMYRANSGLCLETQHWPDAPNQRDFPGIILRQGDFYQHITEYSFN